MGNRSSNLNIQESLFWRNRISVHFFVTITALSLFILCLFFLEAMKKRERESNGYTKMRRVPIHTLFDFIIIYSQFVFPRYGLCASIWSENIGIINRVGLKLEVGTVWANCWLKRNLDMPFGGCKVHIIKITILINDHRIFSENLK